MRAFSTTVRLDLRDGRCRRGSRHGSRPATAPAGGSTARDRAARVVCRTSPRTFDPSLAFPTAAPAEGDSMMILHRTRDDQHATPSTWRIRIAVRVPRDDGSELLADATRRVEAAEGVDSAEVVELYGVDPGLSATTVRLEMRVETELEASALERRLADVPGAETVASVEPA